LTNFQIKAGRRPGVQYLEGRTAGGGGFIHFAVQPLLWPTHCNAAWMAYSVVNWFSGKLINCFIYLFIKIHQPDKNIHTVNVVKQAENRLVEWPTQG